MSAKHYYEEIVKLFTELKDKVEGGVKNFYTWRETKGIIDPRGLKASTINNLRTDLYSLKDSDAPLDKKNKEKVDRLIDEYKKYRVWLTESIPVKKEQGSSENSFKNCSWIFYYFRQSHDGASLARAILSIKEDGKKVTLRSVTDNEETEYEGEFFIWRDLFGIFNLKGKSKAKKPLYLQAFLGTKKEALALGLFLTPDFQGLTSGRFVLQLVDEDPEKIDPLILSNINNKETFRAVLPSIRRFLSIRNMNLLNIPHKVYNEKVLKAETSKHSQRSKLFFSEDRPVVFISSPCTSISKKEHEKNTKQILLLKDRIEKYFPELKVEYPGMYKGVQSELLKEESNFVSNLEIIKRTTFFVLIHPGSPKPSACTMEMSWALVYSKVVFLMYSENTIPKLLPPLSSDPSFARTISKKFDDLEKEIEDLWNHLRFNIRAYNEKPL